jgi:hypothetical protein
MVEKNIALAVMIKERVEARLAETVSENGSGFSDDQIRQLLATNELSRSIFNANLKKRIKLER